MRHAPRYPVYIPSKGRAAQPLTIRLFERAGVPFIVAVQPDQVEAYAEWKDKLFVLPENGKGLVYARNAIRDHAQASGAARHWQFDDDIRNMTRLYYGHKLSVNAGIALAAMEDFCDRYENVGLCSPNSEFFIPASRGRSFQEWKPFTLNSRCYTAFLMLNAMPYRWRFNYNEDTDMTLQVLAGGRCTILFNHFLIKTEWTESNATHSKKAGGQAAVYAADGRLKMARQLERVWPGVVKTIRRFGRPQHQVASSWRKFDNKLVRRSDIDWTALEAGGNDEYGMELKGSPGDSVVQRVRRLRHA